MSANSSTIHKALQRATQWSCGHYKIAAVWCLHHDLGLAARADPTFLIQCSRGILSNHSLQAEVAQIHDNQCWVGLQDIFWDDELGGADVKVNVPTTFTILQATFANI